MQPQPSLPLVRAILAAQRNCPCNGRGAYGDPNVSLTICGCPVRVRVSLLSERSDCVDCHRDYDDGPHGIARVPAVCCVDGEPCCADHARDRGATEAQLDAVEDEVARLVGKAVA
jgi:hypothetical protein